MSAEIIKVNFKKLSEHHFDSIPVTENFRRIATVTKALAEHSNNGWWISNCLSAGLETGALSLQEALYLAELFEFQI